MTYEDFEKFVRERCMYETIYDDSDGRRILVIKLLDAYGVVNKAAAAEREACAKVCDELADDAAYRPGGLPQEEQELVAWSRVNMNDHKEGDLGIGTKPYAAQAAMVDQQTQGRMYVDPVTGDVGIGTVKWDASAPLVVHPHPAFQATQPDLAKVGEVGVWGEREWNGLTEDEIKHLWYEACQTNLELTSQLIVHLARNIEAKLKAKNA